jgi:DUF1680 family protein
MNHVELSTLRAARRATVATPGFHVSRFTFHGTLAIAAAVSCLQLVTAAEPVSPKVPDALEFPPPGQVRFSGWIGENIQTCKRGRLMAQSVPDLVQPFAVREEDKLWRCEFWGKWFTSGALAYRYEADPALRSVLEGSVRDLLVTQTPDGGITSYKPSAELSNWDVWGRKYTLLGLLAWHELSGDPKALEAARRHADRVLQQVGFGKTDIVTLGWWNGMAASSILEPMVLLYRRTGDARYLEFARYIVQSWEGPKGPDLVRKALNGVSVFKMFPGPDPSQKGYMSGGSSKAYEMMSCYEGLVELYRATGEAKYLEAAKKVFADIRDTEITVLGSGSSWERWCKGRTRQTETVPEWMETCVTVTWMKLAGQLLRLTGDPLYADEIERSTYNALLGAQKPDGSWWSHFSPLEGQRQPAPEHCNMHMNCCVANGPRALMLLPALAVMSGRTGPVINFYEPATATIPLPSGRSLRLEIKSDYPRSGVVDIALHPAAAENFTLGLRIPAWSRVTKVELNGKSVPDVQPGAYTRLTRLWKEGDSVRLSLDFTVQIAKDPGGSGRVALTRGPVVLALDKRISKPLPTGGAGLVLADSAGAVRAGEVTDNLPAGMRMAFDVPFNVGGKPSPLRFCDYASAGRTWSEDSALLVWIPQPLNLSAPFAVISAAKNR